MTCGIGFIQAQYPVKALGDLTKSNCRNCLLSKAVPMKLMSLLFRGKNDMINNRTLKGLGHQIELKYFG
jgi:hypothetical protein